MPVFDIPKLSYISIFKWLVIDEKSMKIKCIFPKVVLVMTIILLSTPVFAEETIKSVSQEVEQLIAYIKESNCRFQRNGSWYESTEASDHLKKKYQYIAKKGLVKKAEDFIHYAATKSSLSGKLYIVQCEGEKPRKSSEWLVGKLTTMRESK